MGGAQPLAVTMNEGVNITVEIDEHHIDRRLETKYLDIKCIRAQIIENRTILNVIFHFIFLTTYHEVQLFD